ncbi:MAG TPA: phosphate acyltransferase PlsX [Candidatus Pelethenecus faecipullorum]|uniref:Phosphate acyltransferase n=1 Tax=Candidatus Pelethenecus faecipullorum TaxID=2840900 RepID=A0A9D1GR58_9MOLU|nr:phosphate acyltransferase PlsX [Candidatus Pelethenecus faecipullorum]
MIRIAIDANGGDYGLETTVPAAMMAVAKFPTLEIILYGDEEKIQPLLTNSTRIQVVNTKETLSMGEKDPVRAIRNQRNASLCLAMKACKEGYADACVTSGPTQCVVVGGHLLVRRIPQMERVALCPFLPNLDGHPRLLLDVGANVELRPEHIGHLALFATIVSKSLLKVKNPKVGLLNIGSEPGKGREIDKETYNYLKNLPNIDFYGNVEPTEMVDCPTDIVVTDGFTGNICMKSIEGTAKTLSVMLKEEIKSSLSGKIGYLFMRKNLQRFKKRMSNKEVGGAMLFGLQKVVVKAHGNSDPIAYFNAIRLAKEMVEADIIEQVVAALPKEHTDEAAQ